MYQLLQLGVYRVATHFHFIPLQFIFSLYFLFVCVSLSTNIGGQLPPDVWPPQY